MNNTPGVRVAAAAPSELEARDDTNPECNSLPSHNPPSVHPPTILPNVTTAPLPAQAAPGQRLAAAVLAAACLALLITASTLTPSPDGIATHTQLGLAPCGWMLAANTPCPTCGMTTAFASAALARPLDALAAQPLGALMALLTAVLFWAALHVALLGSQLGLIGLRLLRPRVIWAALALGLLAWVYKIGVVRGWTLGA